MTAASSPAAGVEAIRTTVQRLIARPHMDSAVAPTRISSVEADGLLEEVWRVQSEPGALGEVPVLCVQQATTAAAAAAAAAAQLPVVFVLHGTGGSKEQMLPFLRKYAHFGYLACSIDSRYHGERGDPADYTAALVAAFDASGEHPFMYDTAWDLMRVLDWVERRRDVDASRIGMTGISLGGMHTWMTSAVDKRIAAAAPLIGVQNYRYALDNTLWHARVESLAPFFDAIRVRMGKPRVDDEVVQLVWQRICPELIDGTMAMDASRSLQLIAPRPLLIANGEVDMRCPKEGVELAVAEASHAWQEVGPELQPTLYFEPGGGHAVSDKMWRLVDEFFDRHLTPGSRLPKAKAEL
jgi:dienelactone hydrolase